MDHLWALARDASDVPGTPSEEACAGILSRWSWPAMFDELARAVEGEGEREKETYARPVQEENALMESEAFSNALKGGFLAFALVCVAFLLKLSQPVIGEMIDAFPKGGR